MAIVKVLFRKEAAPVLRYVFGHTQPGDPADSESCPPHAEGATSEFKAVRDQHDVPAGRNEAVHIVQSWNEADSNKLTPQTINAMGRQLVEEYFRGHQFVVVTHTETGKVHNHIVVNMINMETGKAIEKKFKHLYRLREINDKLCLAKGLKIPNQEANERKARIPQKVQQMVRAGRESWLLDIKNKADVARFLATSFDQYKDYMDAFGIEARIEEKNITYFYPGRSRGKRGDNLGKAYDKPGLASQFQLNDQRFQAQPEIRANLIAAHAQISRSPMQPVHNSGEILTQAGVDASQVPKDYTKYTKNRRRFQNEKPLSERELSSEIISSDEIRKAKRSISDYCMENNIPLSRNMDGHTVLKDKFHIVILGDTAINTKNGTRGNLIDFVAAHKKLTLLQAVAEINGTQAPRQFEQHFGMIKRNYTAFYIPKPDQMHYTQATVHIAKFIRSIGGNTKISNDLLKHQRAEVSKDGTIRLFAESDPGGTIELTEGSDKKWKEKKQGEFKNPFFQRPTKRNKLLLYVDPKHFLGGYSHILSDPSHRDGILVLMEPNKSIVDKYLGQNPGIQKVQVVTPKHRSLAQTELDFFGVLKQKLHERGIEVSTLSQEKALSHEGLGL